MAVQDHSRNSDISQNKFCRLFYLGLFLPEILLNIRDYM